MEKAVCVTCFKPKATLVCGLCHEATCKTCAQFLNDESFLYQPDRADELKHDTYCGLCYDKVVAPAVADYERTLAAAKDVMIFTKQQNKETRYIKRDQDPIHSPECDDRDEVTMRLAFQAARRDLNSVIDVEVESRKVRNGSYQTTRWIGTGIPALLDPAKLMRDRSFKSQPN
jgi:hypothetical protein